MVQAIRQEAIPYWADAHYEIRFIAIMRTCIYENPLFECLNIRSLLMNITKILTTIKSHVEHHDFPNPSCKIFSKKKSRYILFLKAYKSFEINSDTISE
jgi:hypothetical protein